MPNLTFYRDIPDGPNNPSVDQGLMKTNYNSIDTLIGVDHYSFNDNNGGYHNIIHQPPVIVDPIAIPSVDQLYVKNVTPDASVTATDTQIFSRTGTGAISQMTGYKVATYVQGAITYTEGYQWQGGILYQWGYFILSSVNGTRTYNIVLKDRKPGMIPFPNNCFLVTPTALYDTSNIPTPSTTEAIAVAQNTVTRFGFSISLWANTTRFTGISWSAIGN